MRGASAANPSSVRAIGNATVCAIGVLNLYGGHPQAFDEAPKKLTVVVTVKAITVTLRNHGEIHLTDRLQEPLNSRPAIINQAIGIIAG